MAYKDYWVRHVFAAFTGDGGITAPCRIRGPDFSNGAMRRPEHSLFAARINALASRTGRANAL